jgi:hypothetical protein
MRAIVRSTSSNVLFRTSPEPCFRSAMSPRCAPGRDLPALRARRLRGLRPLTHPVRVRRSASEAWSEGLLGRLADRAVRWRDQVDQVGDPCLVDAGAGVVEADVTVAVQGEQDRIAEPLRRAHGVDLGRRGVVARADHQDGVLRCRIPRSAVVVLAAHGPGGAGGPQPPAQHRAVEAVDARKPRDLPRPAARPGAGRFVSEPPAWRYAASKTA